MGNRIELFNENPDNKDEFLEVSEAQNNFPLPWAMLFTMNDLRLNETAREVSWHGRDEEDLNDCLLEFRTSKNQAINNIRRKTSVARQMGVDQELLDYLEEFIGDLPHQDIVFEAFELSFFYDSEQEMKDEFSRFLSLQYTLTSFPNHAFAIYLMIMMEFFDVPLPGKVMQLFMEARGENEKKKTKVPEGSSVCSDGVLLEDYVLRFGFDSRHFHQENDHNPLVRSSCQDCKGNGEVRVFDPPVGYKICQSCHGSGVQEDAHSIFQTNAVAYQSLKSEDEFNVCPGCGQEFSTNDRFEWTGLRHKCGQKILPPNSKGESK